MSTYSGVMKYVVPGNASSSMLYQDVVNGSMPPGGSLTQAQKDAIKNWINAGAQNN
jgi:hypothetical protein